MCPGSASPGSLRHDLTGVAVDCLGTELSSFLVALRWDSLRHMDTESGKLIAVGLAAVALSSLCRPEDRRPAKKMGKGR